MSEIAETKPTLMSRSREATAALQAYFPGVLVSLIIAVAATFLSEHYGGPVMLFALLLGMAFYFLSQDGPCVAGIEFASKRILRVAVGLLGAQITISEIMKLGPTPGGHGDRRGHADNPFRRASARVLPGSAGRSAS